LLSRFVSYEAEREFALPPRDHLRWIWSLVRVACGLVQVGCDGDCDRCSSGEDEVGQTLCEYQNVVNLFTLMRHRGTLLWVFAAMLSHVPERHRKGACELHEFLRARSVEKIASGHLCGNRKPHEAQQRRRDVAQVAAGG
jgi:hypothetical protein